MHKYIYTYIHTYNIHTEVEEALHVLEGVGAENKENIMTWQDVNERLRDVLARKQPV